MIKSPDYINSIIRDRQSVYPRNFEPHRTIDKHIIESILENATWAPTHKLTQPWKFIVFHDKGINLFFEKQAEIYKSITSTDKIKNQKIKKYEDKIHQVSHVIAVIAQHDSENRIPEIEEIVATSCALQNIYLSLEYHNIAGYLSTGNVCYSSQMADFLQLKEKDKILGFFQLGIPIEGKNNNNRKRISALEKTNWIEK